ncbi:HIRA-interacting protein 3 isoform X1 [Etheostoma spectabile]|uniref:HIRA-interacting protein 3 isoform X1 n=1 Tax=Etheostoma spectabile TaxID=54343 RepID=UPI0013AEBF56|nr:HIRA-interacting protein 3-like isoform X1 [Etheostoma spectabile]
MMVSEKESTSIRRFVCSQLRDEPDLSTLTLGILKRRYLAHVGCKSISPEARNVMKQVVEEELMKMQESDESGSELETAKPRNKRKRDKEKDEVKSGKENGDDESRAKKSRRQSTSSSESEDKDGRETGSEEEAQIKSESEDAEQEVKNSKEVKNGNSKQQINSEESSDEDMNKSEKKGNESDCDDSPKEMGIRRANATKTGGTRSRNTSQGKTPQSDEENETDTDSKSQKSEKNNSNDSSGDSNAEEKVSVEKKDDDPESDSSSLPSIDDEKNSGKESSQGDKKKKKEKSDKGQKQGDKAVVRLKRYISLCGLRPIYKKLLDGCRSVRSQVAVLKKELEELGVHGQPSVKKCKVVRMKREETQELAELDVSNIIATKGRPKRRAASAWQETCEPPSSTYVHTLNSGSDSNEETSSHRGRRRPTDWANLQGIISDDADSN